MSHGKLASIVILGFVCAAAPVLRADERSDRFVGAWKTTAKFAGYDQLLTIGNEGGQWSVRGSFQKDGAVVGAFLGEKVRFAGDALTYLTKYLKKPMESWENDDVTLRIDGDTIQMSFVSKEGEKFGRTFARIPGEPKVVAKAPTSEMFKNKLQATVGEKVVGTWKASGRFDEYWTIEPEGAGFKITGGFWKNGKEVGSAQGKEVAYGKDNLTFKRVFDKKPDPKLGNSTICIFKVTDSGVEFIVGGGLKAKGEVVTRAEAPKTVVKEGGKPTEPKTSGAAGKFMGFWAGAVPSTTHQLILSISKTKNNWIVEGYLVSVDNKRLAYFEPFNAKSDEEGKSMSFTPTWLEKAPPIAAATGLTLTSQPPALRAELFEAGKADKLVVELAQGNPKMYAQLKPPALPKGKAAVPPPGFPSDKKVTVENFKLPRDIAPAKPFAVLDAKQHVMSLAVSPDGKRVAVGSQQTLNGGFTADLAVWDIEQQKPVWIKKKMVAEDLAGIKGLAFSGDGKVLTARINRIGEPLPLRFYNAETGQELKSPPPLKMRVESLAFHPTKLFLAVGGGKFDTQGQIDLIDANSGKLLWTVTQVHGTAVDGLAFSPDGEMIATFGRVIKGKGYCVKLFDAAKGALLHEFPGTPNGLANSVIFSGDGKLVAALFGDLNKPALVIWDVAAKKEVSRITDMATGGHSSRHNIAFLADNKTLAVSCWDRHLHLFDATTGERTGVYPRVYGITVSEVYAVGDGQMLLTHRHTEGLLLWRQSDALPPRELTK